MNEVIEQAIELIYLAETDQGQNIQVGDNGEAVGPFQIHKILVDDVNQILGEQKFAYEDRNALDKSREMARIYLYHYGLRVYEKWGIWYIWWLCQIWNGGPLGYEKHSTLAYVQSLQTKCLALSEDNPLRKFGNMKYQYTLRKILTLV